jgi:AcrR family transcriptional regulator
MTWTEATTSYASAVTSDRPRRRADARRSIEAILAATRDLLSKGSLPPMSAIATAAGVGRVTLYAHFASREVLIEAVVQRLMAETDHALSGLGLDADPAEVALTRLVRTSWSILDRHRTVRTVAMAELGPEALRHQHDRAFRHVETLIARGQDAGDFRIDLPRDWLVATFYAILHTAADEVDAGRLDSPAALDALITTLLSMLRPPEGRP